MAALRAIWNILRALVTAPDVIHWIKKYDAAKKENSDLRLKITKINHLHAHAGMEKRHGIARDHVIIDREVFDAMRDLLS